jgi:hypothetical protein
MLFLATFRLGAAAGFALARLFHVVAAADQVDDECAKWGHHV